VVHRCEAIEVFVALGEDERVRGLDEEGTLDDRLTQADGVPKSQGLRLIEEREARGPYPRVEVGEAPRGLSPLIEEFEEPRVRREMILDRPLTPPHNDVEGPHTRVMQLLENRLDHRLELKGAVAIARDHGEHFLGNFLGERQ